MAPEQLECRTVDARSDIFAFGAVLYEMVTGQRAFDGTSQASVMAAILERDPPRLSSVQPLAPAGLEHIVCTCLAKDPEDRWQTARDMLRELRRVNGADDSKVGQALLRKKAAPRWLLWVGALGLALACALAAAGGTWAVATSRPAAASLRDVRFSVYAERGSSLSAPAASVLAPQFALSPDGSHLAYVASVDGRPMVWVRPLDALTARALPWTEDAMYPFWSPDGRSIGSSPRVS